MSIFDNMQLLKDNNLKILILDDQEDVLNLVANDILEHGIQPLKANSCAEAIKILQAEAHNIILIISDYDMPDYNGFECREKALKECKDIPFVILSAFITKEMALQAVDLKIAAFVDKPYELANFLAIVDREASPRVESLLEERELIDGFIEESEEIIEELESAVLDLEADPDDTDVLNKIYAMVHTIKGTSGFFEPNTINVFAHRLEDLLSEVKNGTRKATGTITTVILTAIDKLKELILALKDQSLREYNIEQLLTIFDFKDELESTEATTESGEEKQKKVTQTRDEVRVTSKTLDEFLDGSGELTVIRNMINKLVRRIEKEYGGNQDIIELTELLDEMHKINMGIQNKIADMRKVSFRSLCRTFPRVIRDISNNLNKEIDLVIEGEEKGIDAKLAKVLSNSLTHMIRNCADHGIEKIEEREKAGKDRKGIIHLSCKEVGEDIIVEVKDNGQGLNIDRISKKAIENGLYTSEEIDKMNPKAIYHLIFEAGFSTAKEVTDISGRGVGMDMVKRSVESIGGYIEIDSTLGEGTTFQLYLPLPRSVLIMNCLMVRTGQQIFAIPETPILRALSIDENKSHNYIQELENSKFLKLDNELLPLVSLNDILNFNTQEQTNFKNIIILKGNKQKYALEIDEILEVEDTVTKKLNKSFQKIEIYSGATFLGDGMIGLVLDVEGIERRLQLANYHLEAQKDSHHPMQEYNHFDIDSGFLIFELNGKNGYAIKLKDIFRLEEFKKESIHYSSNQAVIIYRNKTMPLVSLNNYLKENEQEQEINKEKFSAIIIRCRDHFMAYPVSKILNIITETNDIDNNLSRQNILGTITVEDKTITVLDITKITEVFANEMTNHIIDENYSDLGKEPSATTAA